MRFLLLLFRPRISKLLLASILAATALSAQSVPEKPAAAPAEKKIFEEWAVLLLGGKRSGFDGSVITRLDTPKGVRYRTVEQEEFVAKREGTNLKMLETSKVLEDADGGVLSFEETSSGAGSNIESTGTRDGDDLIVSSRGQVKHYRLPRLSALGPAAVQRLTDAVPLKAGQTFTLTTFESDYPQAPVVIRGTVIGREFRRVNGVNRQLWKMTSSNSLATATTTVAWVDAQGNDVETEVKIPGIGMLDEVIADRAECMKQPEGAELFSTSLLRPQRAIPALAQQAQAFYRISTLQSAGKIELWDKDEQRVLSSKPGIVEIMITVPDFSPADPLWRLPHADTPELRAFLQPSAYLESNSPEIKALAKIAVGPEKNPVVAARRIEAFVANYITKKDLNIGFASAEETAKSREGDCTEHAVLCAALGRAVGLPTRCVLGLGYIPPGADEPTIAKGVGPDTGIFGFHMWAEAWIGPGRWMAMDAALGGFDVGHIAITKTALEEVNPLTDLNVPILQLMENMKIELLRTVPKTPTTKSSPPGVD